jgi:hypothetical protein
MNYPHLQHNLPGGLLIAIVAVVHVFVSHFAVGGGAFLVVTETLARRKNDKFLLDYCRRHSMFFALLTLVFGAVTGVGIWITIGLESPEATGTLIQLFVWLWASEWVFFFVEIAAAIIYAKSWDRLSGRDHQIVGWIYFVAAWMSLFIINGIITFMLTPGGWLQSHLLAVAGGAHGYVHSAGRHLRLRDAAQAGRQREDCAMGLLVGRGGNTHSVAVAALVLLEISQVRKGVFRRVVYGNPSRRPRRSGIWRDCAGAGGGLRPAATAMDAGSGGCRAVGMRAGHDGGRGVSARVRAQALGD